MYQSLDTADTKAVSLIVVVLVDVGVVVVQVAVPGVAGAILRR